MLWSLIKVLLFIAAVAALAFGAGLLMEMEGGVRIAVPGWEFTLGPLQIVVTTLALLILVWLALKLMGLTVAVLRFLNGDETAISRAPTASSVTTATASGAASRPWPRA